MYVCMCVHAHTCAIVLELLLEHLGLGLFPPRLSRTLQATGHPVFSSQPSALLYLCLLLGDCIQSHEFKYCTHTDSSQIYNSALTCLLKSIFIYVLDV